jgi:hypothetical protein
MLHDIDAKFLTQPASPADLPAQDMMPQASLAISAGALHENFGIEFVTDADDLDRYDLATLAFLPRVVSGIKINRFMAPAMSYKRVAFAQTPQIFGLLKYHGSPDGLVDVLLPAQLAGTDDFAVLVYDIAAMFGLSDNQIIWPENFQPSLAVKLHHAQMTARG